MVKKGDGSWRPCGDYRLLNLQTVTDRYPIPNMADFAANLAGTRIFSTIDLVKSYHQLPVNEKDICKTAVITPFGLYEYITMPFGLKNSGASFQRMMDQILGDLPHSFVYVDDILVASRTAEEHRQHLHEVFARLRDAGLTVNADKCIFGQSSVEFLGHQVSAEGIRPLPDRVADIQKFATPKSVKDLQRFLGMINFYRRFIPSVARILAPLNKATTGKILTWNPTLEKAFLDSKEALAKATMLAHPVSGAHITLAVDASDSHGGGVLQQTVKGTTTPLSFFSKKLQGPEI